MTTTMQPRKTRTEVIAILDDVRFRDREFHLIEKGPDLWLLQMVYYEADVEKPNSAPVRQSTRKWHISPYMTTSEIVETAWAMVCRSQIHVASEHFSYRGRRVYSQHFDVEARVDLCDRGFFDKRVDIPGTGGV
jgi:hypothetical protein